MLWVPINYWPLMRTALEIALAVAALRFVAALWTGTRHRRRLGEAKLLGPLISANKNPNPAPMGLEDSSPLAVKNLPLIAGLCRALSTLPAKRVTHVGAPAAGLGRSLPDSAGATCQRAAAPCIADKFDEDGGEKLRGLPTTRDRGLRWNNPRRHDCNAGFGDL